MNIETKFDNKTAYLLAVGSEECERLDILNEIYNPYSIAFINKIIHGKEKPQLVAEMGCGHGHMLRYFARELPDSHIVGIDISEEQIRQAEAYAR